MKVRLPERSDFSILGAATAGESSVPTILRKDGYRFYFFSHEPNEPPHVDVDKGGASAKFWLEPVSLARNMGFGARELGEMHRVVQDNRASLLEAWNGFFGKHRR